MAGKTTYFETEKFFRQGVFNQVASECTVNDLVFREGVTLAHHEIKRVLDICNKYNNFDINYPKTINYRKLTLV